MYFPDRHTKTAFLAGLFSKTPGWLGALGVGGAVIGGLELGRHYLLAPSQTNVGLRQLVSEGRLLEALQLFAPTFVASGLGVGIGSLTGYALGSALINETDPIKRREKIKDITLAAALAGGFIPFIAAFPKI